MSPSSSSDRYTHGHQESVVTAHSARTIANSAAYLEPHLRPGLTLLDVGCGPGSITNEFAERLGPAGSVLGIDSSDQVIAQAQASYDLPSLTFQVMDLYALDIEDDTYDVVHAHQVLQHVSDPVACLREMHRVTRPGGVVAARDADYAGMHWAPASNELTSWQAVYRQVAQSNDAEPDAGRHLMRWARQAGLGTVEATLDTWLFATEQRRQWWGSTWARRVVESSLAEQAVEQGLATKAELDAMAQAWRSWANDPDGWFVVPHGQLICHV